MILPSFRFAPTLGLLLALPGVGWCWDYEGHRLVNQLALASLPADFPAFVQTAEASERIAFLAGEADRWRNTPDLTLKHCNGPDHFFDLDLLPPHGLKTSDLSPFRYEFVAQLAQARASRPGSVPPIDPLRDADKTRALIGFLPWAIAEQQGKLKSAFSYLKEYENAGTTGEIANARQNIVYLMGTMGHFVGDGSQPLHTTKHHHGWVGENPHGYSTNSSIHSWIDGGYLNQFKADPAKLRAKLRPARLLAGSSTNLFPSVLAFLARQHEQVERLYRLEKAGKLSGRRELSEDGHGFITDQLLEGAQMLGDLWLTAWRQAPRDNYLRSALERRKDESVRNPKRPPAHNN